MSSFAMDISFDGDDDADADRDAGAFGHKDNKLQCMQSPPRNITDPSTPPPTPSTPSSSASQLPAGLSEMMADEEGDEEDGVDEEGDEEDDEEGSSLCVAGNNFIGIPTISPRQNEIQEITKSVEDVWREFTKERWEENPEGIGLHLKERLVDLFETFCESYSGWHQSVAFDSEHHFQYVMNNTGGASFFSLATPKDIPSVIPDFLGDFVIRKTMSSEEEQRHAAEFMFDWTKWLIDRGYVSPSDCEFCLQDTQKKIKALPASEILAKLIFDESQRNSDLINSCEASIDGYFVVEAIDRIDGILRVSNYIGTNSKIYKVKVPKVICEKTVVGWILCLWLSQRSEESEEYFITQSGNVYPEEMMGC